MFEDILKTLVTAMLPILEIRGAIPVGVAAGMDPWTAFTIGFVGNMLPVPFLILLARKVIEWMKKHHRTQHIRKRKRYGYCNDTEPWANSA